MLKNYLHARRIGGTRRESLRFALLAARLTFNDPPTDIWGRPAAWDRSPTGS